MIKIPLEHPSQNKKQQNTTLSLTSQKLEKYLSKGESLPLADLNLLIHSMQRSVLQLQKEKQKLIEKAVKRKKLRR